MANILRQLYDEQGRALNGRGASKDDIFNKGLLRGAAHVWIWRDAEAGKEVLLQRRAATKSTWPNRYDISTAGHIDLGETPIQAALREAKEEIDLDINESTLRLISVHRAYMITENGAIENEFRWLYLLEMPAPKEFSLQRNEVSAMTWKPIKRFKKEVVEDSKQYVPHGTIYYETVVSAIESAN
jgi:isopentenyldiphosphate isomerase